MPDRTLYSRRLMRCQLADGRCGICAAPGRYNLFDAEILARVCLSCGEDSGIAQIALRDARLAPPGESLIRRNP